MERLSSSKFDKIIICLIVLINTYFLYDVLSVEESEIAYVYYNGEMIKELKLDEDSNFEFYSEFGEGLVEVTVKNGKVAITKETSPQNICSKQGYVNVNVVPLICLPNRVEVRSNSTDSLVDEVAQ